MKAKELFFGSDELTSKQENIRQLAMYPFAGVFTAVANFVSFVIMDMLLPFKIPISITGKSVDISLFFKQLVSWICTILTAHTSNRIFVFRSKGSYLIELFGFAAARLLSFVVIELLLFTFMVSRTESLFNVDREDVIFYIFSFGISYIYVIKIVNNLILIAANFILSKFIVFRHKNPHKCKKEVLYDDD